MNFFKPNKRNGNAFLAVVDSFTRESESGIVKAFFSHYLEHILLAGSCNPERTEYHLTNASRQGNFIGINVPFKLIERLQLGQKIPESEMRDLAYIVAAEKAAYFIREARLVAEEGELLEDKVQKLGQVADYARKAAIFYSIAGEAAAKKELRVEDGISIFYSTYKACIEKINDDISRQAQAPEIAKPRYFYKECKKLALTLSEEAGLEIFGKFYDKIYSDFSRIITNALDRASDLAAEYGKTHDERRRESATNFLDYACDIARYIDVRIDRRAKEIGKLLDVPELVA